MRQASAATANGKTGKATTLLTFRPKDQEGRFRLITKGLNRGTGSAYRPFDVIRRAVAKPQPDHFWRRASQESHLMKILILGDDHKVALDCPLP